MLRPVALAVAASLAALGCSGSDPYKPGEAIGTFHVTAALASSTCGAVPNPWEFDVRLRHDGSTLYWVQGGAPVAGAVGTDARAVLRSGVTDTVREADPRTRLAACSILRQDTLDVVLSDAAKAPAKDLALVTSLAGTIAYAFTPTEGSDCTDQVAAAGDASGDGFAALPCTVQYSLSAVKTGDAR